MLDRPVRDRRQSVENRAGDAVAIDGVHQRLAHVDVTERGDPALVERDVLVGVARRAVDRDAGNGLDLAVLVPREHRHQVHLAALQLVDAGVGVGDEAEEDLLDLRELRRRASSSGTRSSRMYSPLFHSATRYGPVPSGDAVVVGGPIDVASLQDVLRQQCRARTAARRARRSRGSARPRSADRACRPTRCGRSRRCSPGCRTDR